jgi:hypothetical protein
MQHLLQMPQAWSNAHYINSCHVRSQHVIFTT